MKIQNPIYKLFFVSLVLMVSIAGGAQTFDTKEIKSVSTGIQLRASIASPYQRNYAISTAFFYQGEVFKNKHIPEVKLYNTGLSGRMTGLNGIQTLLDQTKYLVNDSVSWSRFSVLNVRSGILDSDSFSIVVAPSLDSFFIEAIDPMPYHVFGVNTNGTWFYSFEAENFRIKNKYRKFRDSIDRGFNTLTFYNMQNEVVYHQEQNGDFMFINDTSVFGNDDYSPDSVFYSESKLRVYYPSYTTVVGYDWEDENPTVFDFGHAVTFNQIDTFFIIKQDMIFDGAFDVDLSLDDGHYPKIGPIEIEEFSTRYKDYGEDEDYYLLFRGRDTILDFQLYAGRDYYNLLVVSKSDSLDDISRLHTLFDDSRVYLNEIPSNIVAFNQTSLFRIDSFNKYQDGIYGYSAYSRPLEDQDTFTTYKLYAGLLDKAKWKVLKSKSNFAVIELTKNQERNHSEIFVKDYIIYRLTDTGFVLYDFKYGNKVMSNSFNAVYLQDEEYKSTRPSFRARSASRKYYRNNRFINQGDFYGFQFKRVRRGLRRYWIGPYKQNGGIADLLNSDTIYLRNKRYKRAYTNEIAAFKHKQYGWLHTKKINGFQGREFERILLQRRDYSIRNYASIYEPGYSSFSLLLDNTYYEAKDGVIVASRLNSLNSKDYSSITVTVKETADTFTLTKKVAPAALGRMIPVNVNGGIALFSASHGNVVKRNGALFTGSVCIAMTPTQSYLTPFLIDSNHVNNLNKEVDNTITEIRNKHQTVLALGVSHPNFMNDKFQGISANLIYNQALFSYVYRRRVGQYNWL